MTMYVNSGGSILSDEASRKRGRYVHRPKPNGDSDKYLDYVSRAGVVPKAVGSEDRQNPLVSVVQVQMGGNRKPKDPNNPPNVIDLFDLNSYIKPSPKGKKYCSHCGEWVKFEGFSADARNWDGLQSHCKYCRAEHARKIYWAAKHTGVQQAA